MCRVMRVSARGYRAWRSRPASQRTRGDMKVLAHIRENDSLSLGSYGRPRMTMELKEASLAFGERRVGRLMRINGIRPVRTRKHKVTTNSNHSLGIAPNLLDGDFVADMPNGQPGQRDARPKLPSSSTSTGSTTPEDDTHIWAASARSHSKPRWHSEIGDRRKTVTSPVAQLCDWYLAKHGRPASLAVACGLSRHLPSRWTRAGSARTSSRCLERGRHAA